MDLLRGGKRSKPALARLDGLEDDELGLSIHVLCELSAGARLSHDPEMEWARVLSLVEPLALAVPNGDFPQVYGQLLALLRGRGERIATMDLLIAAAAIRDGAPLVTRNVRDFERVPGLHVLSY